MTQRELAIAIGRGDAMSVSRWERGEHRPDVENMEALARVLKRDVAWFYSGHEMRDAA